MASEARRMNLDPEMLAKTGWPELVRDVRRTDMTPEPPPRVRRPPSRSPVTEHEVFDLMNSDEPDRPLDN